MVNAKYDKLKLFPNQLIDRDPTECVGLSVADIAGNILGFPCDPDFSYAMALRLMGVAPSDAGSDPWAGMQAAFAYGVLPTSAEDFTAATKGELYVANWQNYAPEDVALALQNKMPPPVNVLGNGDAFDSIKLALVNYHQGISVPLLWYGNFVLNNNGVLPAPQGKYTPHNIPVYDCIVENGVEYLVGKPLLGKDFGDGGYVKISRDVLDVIIQGAYTFDPNASRTYATLAILLTRFPYLISYLPQLIQALAPQPTPPATQPSTTMPTVPFKPKIIAWANAIAQQEGAKPALCNPGNLKVSTLTRSWGALPGFQALDGGYIAKFPTYAQGFTALCNFLTLGAENELIAFHEARTLGAFSKVYAGNPPTQYITNIAEELGVTVDTLIETFLN